MTGQFTAAANKREGHTHVLLITTGSVASIKAPLIVEELLKVSSSKLNARKLPPAAQLNSFPSLLLLLIPNPATRPRPRPRERSPTTTVQGRIGAGGRDQAVAHVFPAG
jgi:hypothetical protein